MIKCLFLIVFDVPAAEALRFNTGEDAVSSVGIAGDSAHTHTFQDKNKLDRNIHLTETYRRVKSPAGSPSKDPKNCCTRGSLLLHLSLLSNSISDHCSSGLHIIFSYFLLHWTTFQEHIQAVYQFATDLPVYGYRPSWMLRTHTLCLLSFKIFSK